MHWHPTLSPAITTVLLLLVAAAMVASFVWSRRQLDPARPAGALAIGLRLAAFVLLSLVFLQPSKLPGPRVVTTRRVLAVLVDTSASMSTKDRMDATGTSTTGGSGGSGGSGGDRLDQTRKVIADRHVFEQIEEVANLALYTFDGQAVPVESTALEMVKPTGKQTDLAAAMEQVVALHQNDDLAGLVLFSDGRNTQGAEPREAAAQSKVPIHVVPIGVAVEDSGPPDGIERLDLAIESVGAEPRIVLGRKARVVVSVAAEGYPARRVNVQLLRNDRVSAETVVAISPRQTNRKALFTVHPDSVGTHRYRIRIPIDPEEADPTNNVAEFTVEVVDPVNRLVYFDRLRYERRFLKAILDSRKNLLYAAVVPLDDGRNLVQGNDSRLRDAANDLGGEQLLRLKVVIIGDLTAAALGPPRIDGLVEWVDSGGSLLILAGPQTLGENGLPGTALGRVLPVSLPPRPDYIEGEYRVRLTPEGAAHPAFQRVAAPWEAAAPLLSRFTVLRTKSAATVLFATLKDPPTPIVVSWRYGHGKVAIVLTDSTWRWQLAHRPTDRGLSHHGLFWHQMIDWLLPDLREKAETAGQVQLITDRVEYELNDTVTLMVSVADADGAVPAQARVQLTIATPDGRPSERAATLQPMVGETDDAAFLATFDAYAEGEYAVRARATLDGRTLGTDRVTIRVIRPLIESTVTDPDHELLRDLASVSSGQYLQAHDLDDLVRIADLMPREVLVQPSADRDARPVWNRWWLLILFVLLMAGEWFVRKKNQWV